MTETKHYISILRYISLNHLPSAYLKLDHNDDLEDKLTDGHLALHRHSPVPVDQQSGVYTGLKGEIEKQDIRDTHENGNKCVIKDNPMISMKSGGKEWF